mmetsp:Transcript_18614/g.21419  ORF Transcript_18614/g.21419 Transcript_18614/m.21419 type:complete len:84 (+) Transcript_18614:371-622(+)
MRTFLSNGGGSGDVCIYASTRTFPTIAVNSQNPLLPLHSRAYRLSVDAKILAPNRDSVGDRIIHILGYAVILDARRLSSVEDV